MKPFVSIAKDHKIEGPIRAKRRCDDWTNGESLYCVDHSGKQVGKAALQFWFEVLLPLKSKFGKRVAVWPFDALEGRDIVVAECYPTECQRMVYGKTVNKRQSFRVANALSGLLTTKDVSRIETATWVYAASSEDEFDMFTTAFAFRETLEHPDGFFWHPTDHPQLLTVEGWMLGLKQRVDRAEKKSRGARKPSTARKLSKESKWTKTGSLNRNGQKNIGPAGVNGPKGPLYRMKCSKCGHEYNTNAQDIFQKRCDLAGQHSI